MSLHESPLDDDFNGEYGRDVRQKPWVKIAYEVSLKSEEKAKRKKKTKETTTMDEGEDDSGVRKIVRDVNKDVVKLMSVYSDANSSRWDSL